MVCKAVFAVLLMALAIRGNDGAAKDNVQALPMGPAFRTGKVGGGRPAGSENETCPGGRLNCINMNVGLIDLLNRQVNLELYAFYTYTAMSNYFASVDGAMRGCSAFYSAQASEEMKHAQEIMAYITTRGGDLVLANIEVPGQTTFSSCGEAMTAALRLETHVTRTIVSMYKMAEQYGDVSATDFLDPFVQEQTSSVNTLAHYSTILGRMKGDAVGEYMFDEQLYESL